MGDSSLKIMIVAGEASGDLHGANLVGAMRAVDPFMRFAGVGGRKMADAGVERIADCADMAVMGFTEIIAKLKLIMNVRRRLITFMHECKPNLLVLIDYPGFNISLAKAAKKIGVPVFYYISPKVWAWRKGRVRTLARVVDAMAVIFPFEESIYRQAGVNVRFVGHPLLDAVEKKYTRKEAIEKFGLEEQKTTVGLLPGSRQSEVSTLLPEMLKAAQILRKRLDDVQFILPVAGTLDTSFVRDFIRKSPVHAVLINDHTYDAIAACDLVIVASGTATLETALLTTPMIIVYKVSPLSYYIGKAVINVSHIGLPNIIAGETVVPELIQGEATAERMAGEALDILAAKDRREKMIAGLSGIREKLGKPGASSRAASMALGIMTRGKGELNRECL